MTNHDHVPSIVRNHLEKRLLASGFRPIARHWIRDRGEVLHLANVQRSSYGPYFFLNLGIWFKKVEPDVMPKGTAGCHIEFRPEETSDNMRNQVALQLDESTLVSSEERKAFIEGPLFEAIESVFEEFHNCESACKYSRLPWQERANRFPMVHRKLLEYCDALEVDSD